MKAAAVRINSVKMTVKKCRPSFWILARNLGSSLPITHGEMQSVDPFDSHLKLLDSDCQNSHLLIFDSQDLSS